MNNQIEIILNRLNQRKTLQPLLPKGVWDRELEATIEALDWDGKNSDARIIALMAGFHLRNDSLDTSHSYAQQIEDDDTGAYWHGIMHRMEGDYFNSKYWFRESGSHPAMQATRQRVAAWLQAEWDPATLPSSQIRDYLLAFRNDAAWQPAAFVDIIAWQEKQADTAESTRQLVEQIQHIEVTELFDYTLNTALRIFQED